VRWLSHPHVAGGNTDAALYRLGRCRDLLLEEQRRQESPGRADANGEAGGVAAAAAARAAACRLGAVCGSLGDCWRRRGDLAAAGEELRASADHLRPHAATDAEAAHALSVTLSKLGDLQYYVVQQQQQQQTQQPQQQQRQGAEQVQEHGQEQGQQQQPTAGVAPVGAAADALPFYEEALALRRALCGPLNGGRAGPAAVLDLVSALAKVADAQEVR
jgi:hypothetical protein